MPVIRNTPVCTRTDRERWPGLRRIPCLGCGVVWLLTRLFPVYVQALHTPACAARIQEQRAKRQAYTQRWPCYCRECGGAGAHTWEENHAPWGSGRYWPETMAEPCACTLAGRCPRCGAQNGETWPETEHPCPACGWNGGRNPDDLCPEEAECLCWLEEEWEELPADPGYRNDWDPGPEFDEIEVLLDQP